MDGPAFARLGAVYVLPSHTFGIDIMGSLVAFSATQLVWICHQGVLRQSTGMVLFTALEAVFTGRRTSEASKYLSGLSDAKSDGK